MDPMTLVAGCALSINAIAGDAAMLRSPCTHEAPPAIANPKIARHSNRRSSAVDSWSSLIAEASQRFAISEQWVRKVMQIESRGDPTATSPKGAMGLMQIMPQTYAELRWRYGLGDDPYRPRDNIMAGAAYLREMFDRYGPTSFIAAYNAGPARFDEYLTGGRVLPDETIRYIAKVGQLPDGKAATDGAEAKSSLFVAIDRGGSMTPVPAAGTLFVPVSTVGDHR
jgi:soluble lytic murein transglycosylase-like protein